MEIYTDQEVTIAKVEEIDNGAILLFRDITSKLIAVSILKRKWRLTHWKITVIDEESMREKKINSLLLVWSLLKYSERWYFPSRKDVRYLENMPENQNYDPDIFKLQVKKHSGELQ